MAEEPDRLCADERAELRALQRRAYGPDADIDTDPAALARLRELETAAARPTPPQDQGPVDDDPVEHHPGANAAAAASDLPRRAARRPTLLFVAGGAALAVAGTALVTSTAGTQTPAEGDDIAIIRQEAADAAAERLALDDEGSYRNPYELYFDGKRDEVLTLPGAEGVASRVVYDEFLPYGTLYGRLVGAGPTEDDRFCMIVESDPSAVTVCLDPAIWGFAPLPKTLVFPAPQFDAASPGEVAYVGYTLEPDGQVVARPGVDPQAASEPEPTRTAVPAPGTQ
ncbi:hypothetical protein FBY40_3397 [Microbacterium sp. SLBN-154]|uniref:hypothetical protein n=1 Tax=Microbacterium sp. SLBN-154 TaxID=2768458 RepID=UPI0011529F85|nr:hypothetical protein [Microbacterium sp. SLBN-154]TQK20853.1 hypothetical protein FBY40_3397 [Microbacterium sp. SLBN-154]